MGFSGNKKSVYDAWNTPAPIDELPMQWRHRGRRNHLRSNAIDHWEQMKPQQVCVLILSKSNRNCNNKVARYLLVFITDLLNHLFIFVYVEMNK